MFYDMKRPAFNLVAGNWQAKGSTPVRSQSSEACDCAANIPQWVYVIKIHTAPLTRVCSPMMHSF